MNKRALLGVFLSMFLVVVVAYAANVKYYESEAGTTNVIHTWGYKASIVQIDPDDGTTDTTDMWVSFDGAADSVLVPANGLVVPLCECSTIRVRRSTGSVSYGVWVHK